MVIRSYNAINHRASRLKIKNIWSSHAGKKVKCIETGQIYPSAMHAVRDYPNTNNTSILRCCNKQQLSCGGLHWCFEDENISIQQIELQRKSYYSKAVICLETKQIFNSGQDAAKVLNLNFKNISGCCNHVKGRKTVGGYHWEFLENCPIEQCEKRLLELQEEKKKNKYFNRKPLYQYDAETGSFLKEYNSLTEAQEDIGGRIHLEQNKSHGFYWSYIKTDNYFNIEEKKHD